MAAHAAEPESVVPPMPERTPKALRKAISQHAPTLLPDFDALEVGDRRHLRPRPGARVRGPLVDRVRDRS